LVLGQLLRTFLEKWCQLRTKVNVRYSTNSHESVNGTKARFAPKTSLSQFHSLFAAVWRPSHAKTPGNGIRGCADEFS
jgi:hypothetical protein